MSAAVERFERLLGGTDAPPRSLVVVNRTEHDLVSELLDDTFALSEVAVTEDRSPDRTEDTVLLVEDGEVVATSPLQRVMDTCLLVNSDAYRQGSSGITRQEAPSVVTELDGTVFEVRGYPASNKEKLLLIVVSRFIERLALDRGTGTLHSTFQRLSRLATELGTRRVYERLGATDVDVTVYGVDDWDPPAAWDLSVRTGTHEGYRKTWCVVYEPGTDDGSAEDRGYAALVALETGPNEWTGVWTYDPSTVRRAGSIIAEEF